MERHVTQYDVAIVGYGPAGEVLASTIGAAGYSVLVVERWPKPYPLPRLTTLDGEVCRVVDATGVDAEEAFENSSVQEACYFVDAGGEPLMVVRYPGELGGWPSRVSVFQPDFERDIAAKVERMANVEVRRGWEAGTIEQDDDGVTLSIAPFDVMGNRATDKWETVRAKWLVGTDGARSHVREAAGMSVEDFDMHERWLNFDADILRPLPEEFGHLKIFLDPRRPHMFMPIGKTRLRLEFRVMESETDVEMTHPNVAWDFLEKQHNLGQEDVAIMRQVVYHYHTRIASEWRKGRILIGGDAAHTMPPYMGQGGNAAIRDGRNLGWKLIEVLSGRSGSELIDTYEAERKPHVTTLVMASDRLSRVVNITDEHAAAKRNEGMRTQGEGHPPDLPRLGAGVLHRLSDGAVAEHAGLYTPQARVRRDGAVLRADTVLGTGFQLWARQEPDLSTEARAYLDRLGCTIAVFDDEASPHHVAQVDGVYTAFMDRIGADVAIVRPDFYLFGSSDAAGADALVGSLRRALTQPFANEIGAIVSTEAA